MTRRDTRERLARLADTFEGFALAAGELAKVAFFLSFACGDGFRGRSTPRRLSENCRSREGERRGEEEECACHATGKCKRYARIFLERSVVRLRTTCERCTGWRDIRSRVGTNNRGGSRFCLLMRGLGP